MPDYGSNARLTGKLTGSPPQTSSWVRVLEDGRVELEYFDYSPAAQQTYGNDVAWTYRVDVTGKARLSELLSAQTGAVIADDEAMLGTLLQSFSDVQAVRDWLREKMIPYEEEFEAEA